MALSPDGARALRAVLWGGLAAGLGDSLLALLLYRVSPLIARRGSRPRGGPGTGVSGSTSAA